MKLTEFELDVMHLFWEAGVLRTNDVAERLAEQKGISVKTVKTVIRRLEKKGMIKLVGQTRKMYIFEPAVTREEVCQDQLPTFVKHMFGNNPRDLIASVIKRGDLKQDDIEYIQSLLAKHDSKEE